MTTERRGAAARYSGYRSYGYLEEPRRWDTHPELGRVPAYDLGLTDAQARRVERLMAENLIFSLHDHVVLWPKDADDVREYGRIGRVEVAYEGLAHSGLDAVIDNMAGPTGVITSPAGWKWDDIVFDIGMRLADVAHQDYVVIAHTIGEIEAARANGQLAMVLGVEGAGFLENEVDRLDLLYGFGVRQLGLVYNGTNMIGGGMREFHDPGLTLFGERVVRRMNELGLSIDLSHAGDRTALDAIRRSRQPVMVSHAGARTVWPSDRMKPDVVLRELAASGGLLGIEAAPHSTISRAHPRHCIDSVMDHFTYCVDLMGIDSVAFGPDTTYGDHAQFHVLLAHLFGHAAATRDVDDPLTRIGVEDPAFERVEYVAGMENPTENFRNVIGWLVKHDYSDDEIAKVTGGNVLRVLRQTWGR